MANYEGWDLSFLTPWDAIELTVSLPSPNSNRVWFMKADYIIDVFGDIVGVRKYRRPSHNFITDKVDRRPINHVRRL